MCSFDLSDPLVQIRVDNSRNILYCRTEKGTLQVYDLGEDGRGLGKVASIPLQTIVHNASHIARYTSQYVELNAEIKTGLSESFVYQTITRLLVSSDFKPNQDHLISPCARNFIYIVLFWLVR